MKHVFFNFLLFVLISISIQAENIRDEWLQNSFNLYEFIIEDTVLILNGFPVKIAYKKIMESQDLLKFGIFDRAVLFTENGENLQWHLMFNGPVILYSNGNRIYDFSDYDDLNFFGWIISPYKSDDHMSIYISMTTDNGKGWPDAFTISYYPEYEQFASSGFPYNYGIKLDDAEPQLVAMARSGMPDINSDAYSYFIRNIKKLTPKELRICRNAIFAQYGYIFKSIELKEYFYHFNWYLPYINTSSEIELQPKHQKLLDFIIKIE